MVVTWGMRSRSRTLKRTLKQKQDSEAGPLSGRAACKQHVSRLYFVKITTCRLMERRCIKITAVEQAKQQPRAEARENGGGKLSPACFDYQDIITVPVDGAVVYQHYGSRASQAAAQSGSAREYGGCKVEPAWHLANGLHHCRQTHITKSSWPITL